MKCLYFKREKGEKGEAKKNLCMSELAILGVAGDTYYPSDDEVFEFCLSESNNFRNCPRFKWVEREKDKETLKNI